MRVKGTIVRWSEDTGLGFARQEHSGEEVVVHITDMRRCHRSPQIGDRISFRLDQDKYQRPWGREVWLQEAGEFPRQTGHLAHAPVAIVAALLMLTGWVFA